MAGVETRDFDSPDETRTPDKTQVDVVRIGATTVGRFAFEPGWRWSECVKPVAGTESCQARHVGVAHSGRIGVSLQAQSQLTRKHKPNPGAYCGGTLGALGRLRCGGARVSTTLSAGTCPQGHNGMLEDRSRSARARASSARTMTRPRTAAARSTTATVPSRRAQRAPRGLVTEEQWSCRR